MSGTIQTEMIRGFIEEVKSYVPLLKDNLTALQSDSSQNDVLEETHRLVHTVKGASSMVGLPGLSHIAEQMETDLDHVLAGRYDLPPAAVDVMVDTVDRFQDYCDAYFNGGVDSHEMLQATAAAFRHMRGMPPATEDEKNALCRQIPSVEGSHDTAVEPRVDSVDLTSPMETDASMSEPDIMPIDAILENDSDGSEPPVQADPSPAAVRGTAENKPAAVNPDLLESFLAETEEHLDELDNALNRLESDVTGQQRLSEDNREELRRIRRAVHTLKGAAAVIGLTEFAQFAHKLEDLLDWLYESAPDISPQIVNTLTISSDLLARMVTRPELAHSEEALRLKSEYDDLMPALKQQDAGLPDAVEPQPHGNDLHALESTDAHSDLADGGKPSPASASAADEAPGTVSPVKPTQTLRVSMDRFDELVYLAGELIIASSVLDQKLERFNETVSEMELTRARLRDIAREMELSYEVKALERLSPALNMNLSGSGAVMLPSTFEDFDSLELDRYSELNLIIRSLNESVVDIGALNNQLSGVYGDFDGNLNRLRVIISELQDKIMRVRMTPMSLVTNRMRRTVREVAAKLNRNVRLVIEGEDIELDRMVWDKITDPLMHLLRNAVDHGAEPPEVRRTQNKAPTATIQLLASREGNQVVIRVIDDGAGLDYDAIRNTALRHGPSKDIDSMDESALAEFIFHPGFTTRSRISEVSGRGVGMDIVRENIRSLKGDIQVMSVRGQRTEFRLRIPLTLAAIRALLFSVAGQSYAIALNEISQIMRGDPQTMLIQEDGLIRISDEIMPVLRLEDILKPAADGPTPLDLQDNPLMLIVELGTKKAAVIIDTLLGQREIVIKSLGSHLQHVKGVSGATILGDGRVVPILNLQGMLEADAAIDDQTERLAAYPMAEQPLQIMIVDDSVSIRKVVARLVEDQGWRAVTAKDGVDALEKLREQRPDLIVLDIEMPRMNGYELLATLRAHPDDSQIPVVMLSSRATGKHRDKALSLGAKAFVVKPYNDDEFIELMVQLTHQ